MNKLVELASKYGEINRENTSLTACITAIKNSGYYVSDGLVCFLQEYNGFQGYHSAYKNSDGCSKFFYINPEKAIIELYKEQVESYEKITQCPLVPIGECDDGYIILMYGDDVIYGVFDEYVYKYGQDIESCFDVLINGKEAVEIN
ncbi:SUKH-3 domain-containing protein [Lonsdalea quercina]|uniref:SUKH-3 domain-containing protein n=1 Tax=Lonsdalea quercina TaxID=71657 RepID=UPI003975E77C